jgi:hypothetical protein
MSMDPHDRSEAAFNGYGTASIITQSGADRWEPPAWGGTGGIQIRVARRQSVSASKPNVQMQQLNLHCKIFCKIQMFVIDNQPDCRLLFSGGQNDALYGLPLVLLFSPGSVH